MKKINLYAIALFLFSLHVQHTNAQDIFAMNNYFKSKDFLPAKAIVKLFTPPETELMNADINESNTSADSGMARVLIGCDNGSLWAYIRYSSWPNTRFCDIQVSGDVAKPASGEALKAFATKMKKEFRKEEIEWVEKKIGKSVDKMDAKELCLSFLNLQFYTERAKPFTESGK